MLKKKKEKKTGSKGFLKGQRILDVLAHPHYRPMRFRDLCQLLGIDRSRQKSFQKIIKELVYDHKIAKDRDGKYHLFKEEVYRGIFRSTTKGYGFVSIEGRDEDIFIPQGRQLQAFDNDEVKVVIFEGRGKKMEGEIIEICQRANTQFVGRYQGARNYGFVILDNPKIEVDIYIPKGANLGALDGHQVLVEVLDFGDELHHPEGKVLKILGHPNDPGVDILSLVYAYGINPEFPEEVMKEVSKLPMEVHLPKEEITEPIPRDFDFFPRKQRLDLRHWEMVTIDGKDAKDLDDAISIYPLESGYILGVHIADVSEYVTLGSELDKEALKRGTSIYLADRVVPMLPHALSNGICSLNAGEDRLALSCLMKVNQKGEVIQSLIAETLIHIDRRMSYDEVDEILGGNKELLEQEFLYLRPMIDQMKILSDICHQGRYERGAIEFNLSESKIKIDELGKVVDIVKVVRGESSKIIESFMLLANETVAKTFVDLELPFMYRVHEEPEVEKLDEVARMIRLKGYHIDEQKEGFALAKEIQKVMESLEGAPEEAFLAHLMLRSMQRAKYLPECEGHFGLASPFYCHFTSPIRRYPDLYIHRVIKLYSRRKLGDKLKSKLEKRVWEKASLVSSREQRADELEREVSKLKKVEYMSSHIGEIFAGVISGITSYGIYVELENTVEGMIRITDLVDDQYIYMPDTYEVVAMDSQKKYRLGDSVKIKVLRADKHLREIDFDLVLEDE